MHKTIVLAGGSGLIGTRLRQMLREGGNEVRILTRNPVWEGEFGWNPAAGRIDTEALAGADAVINLAGAGIADAHWTPRRKKQLIDSRVVSADILRKTMRQNGNLPECYLSAAAVGWYGNTGEEKMYEVAPPGRQGFLSECCIAWEQGAEKIAALGIRTTVLRIGIVLAKDGGALTEIVKPMRYGIGPYFGNGRAWWSWIHLDDLCRMFIWALEHKRIEGTFNAVAPHPVRNLELVKACARAMHRRVWYAPVPAPVLHLVLGELSTAVLGSNYVSCEKALNAGFTFVYPELDSALGQLFGSKT